MNTRLSRVEQTLRRALAEILLRGDLRDPRLRQAAAISITAVKISPDLGSALVYVDVLGAQASLPEVLAGLTAGAPVLRAKLSGRLRLRRTPKLRFVEDQSIGQGLRIEEVLAEVHTHDAALAASAAEDDASEDDAIEDEPGDGEEPDGELDAGDEPDGER